MSRRILLTSVLVAIVGLAPVWSVIAEAQPITLTWIEWMSSESGKGVVESAVELYEKQNPGTKIEMISLSYTPIHDKVINLFMAKRAPDVIQMVPRWVAEFADMGIVAPLDTFLSKEGTEYNKNLAPATLIPWKNRKYVLPVTTGPVILFYNKDLFLKYGIKSAPANWSELLAAAQKVNDPANGIYAFTGNMNLEPPTCIMYEVWPYILQAGADLVKDGKAVFNSPEGVTGFQFYLDLVNKYKVMSPGVLSAGEKEKRENFSTGKIAMMTDSGAGITIQRKRNPQLNFGIAPLPKGNRSGSALSGWELSMSTQTKHPEEAWKFMKFMSTGEGAAIITKANKMIPGYLVLMRKGYIQDDPEMKMIANIVMDPTTVAIDQVLPQAMELRKLFTIEVQEALMGKKTAKQALDSAAEKWNEVLSKAK